MTLLNSKIKGANLYVRVSLAYLNFQLGIINIKIEAKIMNININIVSFSYLVLKNVINNAAPPNTKDNIAKIIVSLNI